MLDVHPPHEAAHSWKDFLIHIATIVIGLLIAIGLEQSVEWVHHHNELAETRRALDLERKLNVNTSVARTKEFTRVGVKLQTDLSIFQYLAIHPGAPPDQWPGKLSWTNLGLNFDDSAWQIASKSNVIAYMPHAELVKWTELYGKASDSNNAINLFVTKVREAGSFTIREPDPSRLTPEQINREIDLLSGALFQLFLDGSALRNLAERFPDFSSPTNAELESIRRTTSPPEDVQEARHIQSERHRLADQIEKAHTE